MSVIKSKPTHSNLFPAPKNTKPRTRVRVFKERHTPNPEHHNYNREQNFNQKLSSTLAWLNLQCVGAASNLNTASSIAFGRLSRKDIAKLPEQDRLLLSGLLIKSKEAIDQLKNLSEFTATVNRTKTKLTKEQLGIPNKK